MFELTAAVGDLSTQVKVGWTLWFVWSVLLLGWYRHAHRVAPTTSPGPAAPARSAPASAGIANDPQEHDLTYREHEPTYSDPTGSSATAP